MKKTRMTRLLITVLTLLSATNALAQEKYYFTSEELPNAVIWLPAPPDTTSTRYVYDITQYMWGKTQRLDSLRAQMAVNHAVTDPAEMAYYFSEAFGMPISEETTPAIIKMLSKAIPTIRLSATYPKNAYMRKRPYVRFNEPTLIPEEEDELRDTGSYPSGHTVRGWGMALLLCEINPEAQDAILKLGYEWGQSRVIAGFHWQSDVDASRSLAAACYARLHSSQEFLADMAAARKEYTHLVEYKNFRKPVSSLRK